MKSNEYWALYNCSVLWHVAKTRKECKISAEDLTGEKWKDVKDCLVFKKIRIIEIAGWSKA